MAFTFALKQETGHLLRRRWEDRKGKNRGEEWRFEIIPMKNAQAGRMGWPGQPRTGSFQGLVGLGSHDFTKAHMCSPCPQQSWHQKRYTEFNLCAIGILQNRHREGKTWTKQS